MIFFQSEYSTITSISSFSPMTCEGYPTDCRYDLILVKCISRSTIHTRRHPEMIWCELSNACRFPCVFFAPLSKRYREFGSPFRKIYENITETSSTTSIPTLESAKVTGNAIRAPGSRAWSSFLLILTVENRIITATPLPVCEWTDRVLLPGPGPKCS